MAKARQQRLGRLVLNHWLAQALLGLLLVSILLGLARIVPLIIIAFFGPLVGVILLANILNLDQELPDALHLQHLGSRRVIGFLSVVMVVLLLILGIEVWIKGPDLRTDGLHGFVFQPLLGFYANPVTI